MLIGGMKSAFVSCFAGFAGMVPVVAAGGGAQPQPAAAGNEKVRHIMETYAGRGTLADSTPPTPPDRALGLFTPGPGLAVDLIAAEPDVEQPLYLNWDSRGRLWVTQYRQYQFPAGLKIVSYDSHLRAQFDRMPQPPPLGEKGADKVTVLEDADGDGVFEKKTEVLTGLNIASAALPGAGAVWVLNPPYLLRYPDADADGIPDGDPEVALSGFGIEDTHSVASSLQWGVDGWLYGANGSTSTGNVSSAASRNVRWEGQCIWRYHPESKRFEIYAEGGGNTFSLDIDSKGRVFSGTNAGATRGMHYEQGSYGVKSWGKHGPLTNPHAYGFFAHMAHEGDSKRFPQAFVVYEGGLLGGAFSGRIIAPNSLANLVYVSELLSDGSTFRTRDEANLISSTDRWFRPVDAKVGPDGAVYLADWYDTRLSHVRPVDDWHKTSGRIYRVRPEGGSPKLAPFNLHAAPPGELLGLLDHPNRWFRRQAALEIGWRRLDELASKLAAAASRNEAHALDALFALDLLGKVAPAHLEELLRHGDPYVRRWAVKIAGEKWPLYATCAQALERLAREENHLEVRAQLLATGKRIPAGAGLRLFEAALGTVPTEETRLPLMAWWLLESKVDSALPELVTFLKGESRFTGSGLFEKHISRRLGQRLAAGGSREQWGAASELYEALPGSSSKTQFLEGVSAAIEDGDLPGLPPALGKALVAHMAAKNGGESLVDLRSGKPGAVAAALKVLQDPKASEEKRVAVARALGEFEAPEVRAAFAGVLANGSNSPTLRRVVLLASMRQTGMEIPQAVISGYEAKFAGDRQLREAALRALAGRLEWAAALVQAVEDWKVPAKHVSPEIVALLRSHDDAGLREAVGRLWKGVLGVLSPEAKAAEAGRLRKAVRAGAGDAVRGRLVFQERCAACHKLFGEGDAVGPELTGYERGNLDFWVDNIVYPSLEIREGFANYTARLKNGQVFIGMLDSQSAREVVLREPNGQKTRLRQSDLAALEASPVSLMPEGILAGLSDESLQHLFAYLQRKD
jgi:putative membrane-bound dehydrogenase-like protein